MNGLLHYALSKVAREGDLHVTDHRGVTRVYGDGTGEPVHVRFTTAAVERAVVSNPELKLGEAYMDGTFVVEKGSIYDFLDIVLRRDDPTHLPWWIIAERVYRYLTRRVRQFNPIGKAKDNVAHHYDLDGRMYDLFLDSDRQYSCAYFETPTATLEQAQLAKKRHLAAKLQIEKGQRVLDIGSGWGGLGLYIAETNPVSVVGVTLSEEQHALSRSRAEKKELDDRVDFRLQDYRTLEGKFDRIVSVGMFEHVGVGHYPEFFAKVRDLLTDDGVMVLHSIGRFGPPGETNSWIQKYIFPGGYIPSLSEVLPVIEKTGLFVTDIEILRLHYAETLREWRRRFLANCEQAAGLYDERFCRMWEFYLAGSEVSFRNQGMMNFQIQLSKTLETVPLTRGYIGDAEEALRKRDSALIPRKEAAE
ncbi:SAM-dependent methyltransferase [Microbaculum marinisediminis]|uniref:Cyclopropane-fatty-acyl-phospholipid synthase family protein n=1 Tax=Microbaculum marinisediminis TaxID=2931392 RepID=A0AAW5R3M8_9HYPH|nr:cyclopropane-fatty-acyl-phospholipid synthase family protein [Microbaculum sp. A6E488]MCT8973204.1 cyclopropane-fatty-acyl-phospholipid synthase family protein [Microbaculum sp. A6E488]